MNPVGTKIINRREEYCPSRELYQHHPALKSCALPSELRGSALKKQILGIPALKIVFVNHVISDISVVLREATLTISDSIETGSTDESEMGRVDSLSTMEITEITQ